MTDNTLTNIQIYCNGLYELFESEAENVDSEGSVYRVWKGFIVQSAANVGIPDGVYTRVMDRLRILGCLQVIETGRRNTPSVIVLLRPPTQEVWDAIDEKDLTKPPSDAKILGQTMEKIKTQIGEINAVDAFRAIDSQLTSIKERLDAIEGVLNSKVDSRSSS